MTSQKIADIYRADTCRVENGSQADMPIFGRFAARVQCSVIKVYQLPAGDWCIDCGGIVTAGDYTRDEAVEAAKRVVESMRTEANYDGWTTDRQVAADKAIADAKSRHEASMARPSYVNKFGIRS